MSRLVKHTATGPAQVTTDSGDEVWICRCGLTASEDGQCDGTHNFLNKKLQEQPEDESNLCCYDPANRDQTNFPVQTSCCQDKS